MIQSWLAALTIFLLQAGAPASLQAAETHHYAEELLKDRPFWKKPKLYKKILDEREIVVSTIKVEKGKKSHWEMKGVGLVQAPLDQVWNYVRDFEKLKQAPRHFKRISYNDDLRILTIRLLLLGKEREIVAHIQEHDLGPDEKHLHWLNKEGLYQGLEGVIVVKKKTKSTTEVSELSMYSRDDLKVPGWLFSFVSEAVMKHVAGALRKDLESSTGSGKAIK